MTRMLSSLQAVRPHGARYFPVLTKLTQSREQRDLAAMRETLRGSNALGKAKLDALRFHELKQAFAVSAHVAIDFGQRGKVFAFGLTDVLSRDLRPSLCALDRVRQ
jgi:hypothetical protein